MKRDQIEDRLAVMEREIRTFKQEHRQDMESMREELRRFQAVIVEDRIQEVRHHLAKGYGEIALGNAFEKAECVLGARLPEDCHKKMKEKCVKAFIGDITRAAEHMDSPDSEDTISPATESCSPDRFQMLKGTPCEDCYNAYMAERESVISSARKLIQLRDSLAVPKKETYVADLPDDLVVPDIVDPLSHEARFRMLKGLAAGGMSYSELVKLTGYEGGHLLYHLNRLIDSGLVVKGSGGNYAITKKGMGVMEIVRKMFAG